MEREGPPAIAVAATASSKRRRLGRQLLGALIQSMAAGPDNSGPQAKSVKMNREKHSRPPARVLKIWSGHRAAAVMSAWTRMLTLLATMSTTRTGEAICVKDEAICVKGATGEAICVKGVADSTTSDATVRNPLSSAGRRGLNRTRLSG